MIITDEIVPLDPKRGIVVAFSGGADSLALLLALVARVDKGKLVAVYVNHRLRLDAELEGEEELNQSNCAKLGVPLR
ncbi:MAG: ATP-binding protein, partial [Sphaerochaetaceae bacterium]|nr:ATP-binding protein [Sphaerochaetaceae bacterium]